MQKIAYIGVFILLAIVMVFLFTGGDPLSVLSAIQHPPQPQTGGFVAGSDPVESRRVVFDDAAQNVLNTGVDLETADAENMSISARNNAHIHLVRGHDLDTKGRAATWLFVIRQPEAVSMVTYDYNGEKITPWEAKYPEQEILLNQTITPRELISKNNDTIFSSRNAAGIETIDLDLARDTYYLTITGSGITRNLKFDAKTGAMIPSND